MKAILAGVVGVLPMVASAGSVPEAYWITEDKVIVVGTGACAPGSAKLCGIIVGLLDKGLAPYAGDLCGLPVLWDFTPTQDGKVWTGGMIFDPDSEKSYPAELRLDGWELAFVIQGKDRFRWQMHDDPGGGCP